MRVVHDKCESLLINAVEVRQQKLLLTMLIFCKHTKCVLKSKISANPRYQKQRFKISKPTNMELLLLKYYSCSIN